MSSESDTFITSRIARTDRGFECGVDALDQFFARFALQNDRRGLGATYVLRRVNASAEASMPEVLGFYTLSMATIESAQASEVIKKLPRYPIPAALIGRLAVDRRAHGRGYGTTLLIDALSRVARAAQSIGCAGVIVDAKDGAAEGFYARYGFVTVDATSWLRRMFMAIETIRSSIARGPTQGR